MNKLSRLGVLVVSLTMLCAVCSSTAGAVTWHNTGDTAFTAVGGPETFSVTGVNLGCTGADVTGTSPAGSVVGATYTMATGTLDSTGCALSGIPTSKRCNFFVLLVSFLTANVGVRCSIGQFGAEICVIEGTAPGHYVNPVSPSTFGKLVLTHSATLRTTNGAAGSCPLGPGEPATLTSLVFTITAATGGPTPHLGPKITRTA